MSSDHSHRLYAGDFLELQQRFLADVAELRARDPLAPLTVLVPNVLAGLSLRRELARSGVSHANVRFRTLTDCARELTGPLLAEQGLRMLPRVLRAPLMRRAIEMAGPLHYFQRMAHRAGFHQAVWNTIDELRAADVQLLARNGTRLAELLFEHKDTAEKLHDITAIWRALDALMQKHKYADRAAMLDLACSRTLALRADEQGTIVYGLDDLIAMERRLVSRLIKAHNCIAYLPFRASDAYIWSEPLYQWYLEQGFEAELIEPGDRASQADALSRVQLGTFEDSSLTSLIPQPSSLPAPEQDRSFFAISAPTRDREVDEILREVLYPPVPRTEAGERIGVLMRDSTNYLELIREAWARAGVNGYFQEKRCLGESATGRVLRALIRLFDGDFRRTDVAELLFSLPASARGGDQRDIEIRAVEWNHLSMRAQIVAGEQSWREHLPRLANQLQSELERREREFDDPAAPLREQLLSLETLRSFIDWLIERVARIRAAKSWQDIGAQFDTLVAGLLKTNDELELFRRELSQIGALDSLGLRADSTEFGAICESLLSQPLERDGKFEVHEPTVAKIADVLGVVFDEIYLCGLVEREFPRTHRQDPLLLDNERLELQRALNSAGVDLQIPLRARLRFHERFLFRVALNSARRRVVLSLPRLDPVEGREWLASTFLLRALEAATGKTADYEQLESFLRTSPQARRVPLNRLQGRAETSVTPFDYDLSQLGQALRRKSADDVAYLFCADADFQRGIAAERARYHVREFTAYDGLIEAFALRERLKQQLSSLSPSRIERFAGCPFKYFMSHVLELAASDEPQWTRPMGARARARLMQMILERFCRAEADARRWPPKDEAWERLSTAADESFTEHEREHVTGLPLLWEIEKDHLRGRLRRFFETQLAAPQAFLPTYFNQPYGLSVANQPDTRHDPVTVSLTSGLDLAFRGSIDRVDVDASGRARLVDYSTSSLKVLSKRNALTHSLEPHIARLAAAALGLDADEFTYYALSMKEDGVLPVARDGMEQARDGVMQFMETVAGAMAEGQFFPVPSDDCRYCEAKAACGTGRFTRKWEPDSPQTRRLKTLRGGTE